MDSYVFLGWTGKDLVEKATNAARKIEMNYIYSATETLDEFRKVCSHAGIPDGDVDEFIKELARNNPVKHGQRRKRSDGTAEIIY